MTNKNDKSPIIVGTELSGGHMVLLFTFGNFVLEKDALSLRSGHWVAFISFLVPLREFSNLTQNTCIPLVIEKKNTLSCSTS